MKLKIKDNENTKAQKAQGESQDFTTRQVPQEIGTRGFVKANGCADAAFYGRDIQGQSQEEMITKARRILINLGKTLPFVLCFLVLSNYIESALSLSAHSLVNYGGYTLINTKLSYFIGQYFEYNIQTWLMLCVASIALETCFYNKAACAYLGINLAEKSYFDFELEPTTIYIICAVNIIVSSYLTFKGFKILLK